MATYTERCGVEWISRNASIEFKGGPRRPGDGNQEYGTGSTSYKQVSPTGSGIVTPIVST